MSRHYKPTMGRGHAVDKNGRAVANEVIKRLQLEFGAYMRKLREDKGLTQRKLGELVGVTDNHVSDIECGNRKISPERYEQFAAVLGLDRPEFGKQILLHYDPFTYKLIFGGKKVDAILASIPERLTDINDE